jgi:hypothetical protein
LIGKTIRDDKNDSSALMIPEEFPKALDIENYKVSMTILDDFDGNMHLVVSRFLKEIVIE